MTDLIDHYGPVTATLNPEPTAKTAIVSTRQRRLGVNGRDPHSYRQHFGLPVDYPVVAPDPAARRAALAKSIGLGRVANRSEHEQSPAPSRKKPA